MNLRSLLALTAVSSLGLSCAAAATPQHSEIFNRGKSYPNRADRITPFKNTAKVPPQVTVLERSPLLRSPEKIQEPTFTPGLPVIYACCVSSYGDWFIQGNAEQIGYYAIQPESNIRIQPICIHPNLFINGGGAFADSRLYYHIWEMYADDGSETGITFNNYFCAVNTDNWSMVTTENFKELDSNIAYDMTVDPVTGNLYAVQWGPYDDGSAELATVNKTTGEANVIAKIPVFVCLAADNFGRLFGVDAKGDTYYINKEDGSQTLLGPSGIANPKYIQSATCDPESNTIYWAAYSDNVSGLYTLNTITGKADLVAAMPDDEEFTGLFIEADRKGLNAPAELRDIAASYSNGTTTVTATLPAKGFDGSALSGNVTAKLYVDGQLKDTKQGAPGAAVAFSASVPQGNHTLVLVPSNAAGDGAKTIRQKWCGNDTPGHVADLNLSLNGNQATLTWQAPREGEHGGSVDAASLRYNVTRYPGAVVVAEGLKATTFTETLPDGVATYYYTVTAVTEMGAGPETTSNSVFMGTAFTTPYVQHFDTESSLEGFTIINSEEGRGWYWWDNKPLNFQAMASRFSMNNASDNYLILPPVVLSSSSEYKLRFRVRVFDEESPERFEVKMGQGASVEALTKTVMNARTIKNEDWMQYDIPFTVNADGTWNVAFHCVSPVRAYYLIIDDIEILETASADAPAPVTGLTAKGGQGGATTATLTFTTPTKTHSGQTLTSLSAVKFYRGDDQTPCGQLTSVEPGKEYTWTDENAPKGYNTYRVAAFSGDVKGVESEVQVFVGFDQPMPVTDAKAVYKADGNVHISWKAPTKGVQGGDINPADLTYTIWTNTNQMLVKDLKATEIDDPRFVDVEAQYMAYYQIHAVYGDQQSEGTLTDFVVAGPDKALPFSESFADGGLQNTPWTLSTLAGNISSLWGIGASISNPSVTPQDGDNGFAYFKANSTPAGVEARMTSPKLDLMNANHPVVKFYVYIPGGDVRETLALEITHNDNVFTKLADINLNGEAGWKEFTVEIPRLHCLESSMIAFHATGSGYGRNIAVDNIRVVESGEFDYEYDLEAVSITGPAELMPDRDANFVVRVYNSGSKPVSDYKVILYVNGQPAITTDGRAMEVGDVIDYTFTVTPEQSDLNVPFTFRGEVQCAADQNAANNRTNDVTLTVGVSGINDVTGSAIRAYASRGNIVITGAEGLRAEIYAADGRKTADRLCTGRTVIPAAPGLYLVKIADRTIKILL